MMLHEIVNSETIPLWNGCKQNLIQHNGQMCCLTEWQKVDVTLCWVKIWNIISLWPTTDQKNRWRQMSSLLHKRILLVDISGIVALWNYHKKKWSQQNGCTSSLPQWNGCTCTVVLHNVTIEIGRNKSGLLSETVFSQLQELHFFIVLIY